MEKLSLQKITKILHKEQVFDQMTEQNLLSFLDDQVCKKIFTPYLEGAYLSNWRTCIEILILQRRKDEFEKYINTKLQDDKVSQEEKRNLREHFSIMQYALYKIVIVEEENIPVSGILSSDSLDMIDTIFINNEMSILEKRCVLAHELGHVIINRFLMENNNFKAILNKKQKEELANIFMYYILIDRSNHYQNKSQKYSIKTIDEITDLMRKICDTFGDPQYKL